MAIILKRIDHDLAVLLTHNEHTNHGQKTSRSSILTPREREVAEQIMLGATNKEIAKSLGLRYDTVKEHVQNILVKHRVDRGELIAIRLLRETLGAEFIKEFDRRASELERKADELKNQTVQLRDLVAAAVRQAGRKCR